MSKIIGIDLGTTNSCVAVLEGGAVWAPDRHSEWKVKLTRTQFSGWIVAALTAVVAAGCADSNNSTQVKPPLVPDAAFVGYSDTATKQTTCGNCHIGMQARWVDTKHASAWSDAQATGHASASCSKCHTTNGATNGNADTTAGYFRVADASKPLYHDVQCESCHGAGSVHVATPDTIQPIPSIAADTGLNTGCGTCHSGSHDPFVEEWRSSLHGAPNSHALGNAACAGCHNGTAALARFQPNANFSNKNSATWIGVTCSVCHDPHGSPNPAQLTLSLSTMDTTTNLCMSCHYRRSKPDSTSTAGSRNSPHAPQALLFSGAAGWQPAGFTWSADQQPTHDNPDVNPRLCASCHVNAFSGKNDAGTTVYSMGHTFNPTPCVTAGGAPDTTTTCTEDHKSFAACTASGCHASQSAARGALEAVQNRMTFYADMIWVDRNANSLVDTTDGGLLAQVKKLNAAAWKNSDAITPAEGAQFNSAMFRMAGTGVHNPFYTEALAIASINALETTYGVSAPAAVQAQFRAFAANVRTRAH